MRKVTKILFHILLDYNLFKFFFSFIIFIYLVIENFNKINFFKKNLLILNNKRFNFNLKEIKSLKNFNLICISVKWQYRILGKLIYNVKQNTYFDNLEQNILLRKKLRFLIRDLFFISHKLFRFKAVIGTSVHYKSDLDIGEYFSSIKVPYIIFHKEGFFVTKDQQEFVYNIYKKYKQLNADLVFVNNNIVKKILKKTCCRNVNVKSYGSMVYNRLNKKNKFNNLNKDIVFFSFHHRAGLFKKKLYLLFGKKGWINLFHKSHKVFIESAIANPNKNYIIKIKWKNIWFDRILKIKNSITKKDIPNLKIVWDENVLNLIERSNKIITFNSSATLESLIKKKITICLNFAETENQMFKNQVIHKKFKNLVHLAKSELKLKNLIEDKNLSSKSNNKKLINKNFRKYLSSGIDKEISKKINKELAKYI